MPNSPTLGELQNLSQAGITDDLLEWLLQSVRSHYDQLADGQRAVNNLIDFFSASRNPLSLAAFFQREPTGLPILLKIFSTSQYLSDILIRDPESYDGLRLSAGQPVSRMMLVRELRDEILKAKSSQAALATLRRFKRRETLRVAYGDIIGQQDLSTVTTQISYIADAICQASINYAEIILQHRDWSWPVQEGRRCPFVVISMGKLGGNELNYSSDIDLIMVYGHDAMNSNQGKRYSNAEYFQKLASELVKMMSETTSLGFAYRVDLRLRPHGSMGSLVRTADATLTYYDIEGRTWERQALVKARPSAGNLKFGENLIEQLNSFVYLNRLSLSDIDRIKSLRGRMERKGKSTGENSANVKTGPGGIRDIEFTVQFLQLLHGRYYPELKTTNTLEALSQLLQTGLLTDQEYLTLDQNYRWLRRLEHRLQLLFDLQTHQIPDRENEQTQLAIRMGFTGDSALDRFKQQLTTITGENRQILNYHLHDAFPDSESNTDFDECDLILDPQPDPEWVQQIFEQYGFSDSREALAKFNSLGRAEHFFASRSRCRHFLAAISRDLLSRISQTPSPRETLVALDRVSANLGGKSLLWELFRSNPPIMNLFIKMCAACPYLCDILASHPGMIDGLLDSLLMKQLPDRMYLRKTIADLVQDVDDIDLVIHAFKDLNHLRVGIRDVEGRDSVARTHASLSDIAEVCLQTITKFELDRLVDRYGQPLYEPQGQPLPCQFIILAMGKLGGREPNYHSDLDVIFLYQGIGKTDQGSINNQEFFERLAAAITKRMTSLGPFGKLFELDSRLRPTGKSGTLAVSLAEFERYFESGSGQLWERQALCKARPITGDSSARRQVRNIVRSIVGSQPWQAAMADEIVEKRIQWQTGATPHNLKRTPGGTVDIEFAVQASQLKHAAEHPEVLVPGTLAAVKTLLEKDLINPQRANLFREAYETFRHIEARIRLMDLPARHDMPTSQKDLNQLVFLLDFKSDKQLIKHVDSLKNSVRDEFLRHFEELSRQK